MADKIKGLTIEIGGQTTNLQKSMSEVNSKTKDLKTELKDVERLLKLDPGNTELIAQKQKLLADSIGETKNKLDQLKEAEKQVQEQFENGEVSEDQYRALQREVIKTEQELKKMEKAAKDFGGVMTQSLKNAGKDIQDFGGKIEGAGKKLAPISTAAAGAVTGILAMGVKAGQSADDINTLAKQTGLTTEEIQKFKYASEIIDVPLETLTGSMAKLTRNMGSAREGTGAAAEAFEALGINVVDSNGSLRNNQDVFDETIKALGEMTNETERDARAMEIFGRSAQDLNPLILGGADALKQLGQDAEDAGLILSQEALDDANAFNDAIDELKATATGSFAGIGTEIATALTPMLKDLAKVIGNVLDWIKGLDENTVKIILTILALVAGLAPLLIIIGKVISAVGVITSALPALGGAFTALTGPIGLVIAAVAAVIAIGVLLYKNWDDIVAFAKESFVVLLEFLTGVWDSIRETFTNSIQTLKDVSIQIWTAVSDAFKQVWETIKTWVSESWTALVTFITAFKDRFKAAAVAVFTFLWDGLKQVWETIKSWVSTAFDALVTLITNFKDDFFKGAKIIFTFLWDGWKNVWTIISEWVMNVFQAMCNKIIEFKDKFKQAGRDIFNGVWDGLKSVWTNISTWVSEKVSWIADKLSFWKKSNNEMSKQSSSGTKVDGSHRSGLEYVPFDGYLSELHRGERVLTAAENKDYGKTGAITHSGTIRVEGVDNKGELAAVVDIVMDQLRREVRMA